MLRNIHIGCSYKIGENWENFDSSPIAFIDKFVFFGFNKKRFSKKIKYGNIVKKLLCPENYAENIYLSHVLEHLEYQDAKKALANIFLMLKKGGRLRIVVPSLENRIKKYLKDGDADKFVESLNFNLKNHKNYFSKLRFLFGGSRHKWMYDQSLLKKFLIECGFSEIRVVEFNDSDDPSFLEVEDKSRFIERDNLTAIAFEAIK